MAVVLTPEDRQSFLRCRKQWDYSAGARQNLEPLAAPAQPDLAGALREALAIYYFPGMWDWDRQITLPLVRQGMDRALAAQRAPATEQDFSAGRQLLQRYFSWAPSVDIFSPVQVEAEYDVQLPDPATPGTGLTAGGQPVWYRGRIHMLAVDQHDAYWIVRHTLIDGDWPDTASLLADSEDRTACWAWEQFYPGLDVVGTIRNELRLPSATEQEVRVASRAVPGWLRRRPARRTGPAVRQHESSGGGRSIPQHRRLYARASEPAEPPDIVQQQDDAFRRTWLRYPDGAIASAGRILANDAAHMTDPAQRTRPNPSYANCGACPFLNPCQAERAGRDSAPILQAAYRERQPETLAAARLGTGGWGLGRGTPPTGLKRTRT